MRFSDPEIDRVSDEIAIWHRYDREIKADLFSTVLLTPTGICVVDPISIPTALFDELTGDRKIVAVVVTNANHDRAAAEFVARSSAPLFAHSAAEISGAESVAEGDRVAPDLEVHAIEGAAPGEIALLWKANGGTLVLGDALINFGSNGFSFLPAKYCSNSKLMRKSLRRLLDFQFERILFAHGVPIVTNAHSRLTTLLEGAS